MILGCRAEVYVFRLTNSRATHKISGHRVQVYVFNIDKVRGNPFHMRLEGTGVYV